MPSTARPTVSPETLTRLGTLAPSLILAEQFYKFHSFTIEFVAFAATWWVLYSVVSFIRKAQ